MNQGYRVTVRGVMSERFRQGFSGLDHRVDGAHTILSAHDLSSPPLDQILSTLGNLGLEIVRVERLHGRIAPTTMEA